MRHQLQLEIQSQPTNTTCGHTCLAAVYDYFDRPVELSELVSVIGQLDGGGTLAVDLACDALRRGFQADILTYNLQLFDPTWFDDRGEMVSADLLTQKLRKQLAAKRERTDLDQNRLCIATQSYVEFLSLGGRVLMQSLNDELIVSTLATGTPMLCGLSATYLYHEARERSTSSGDPYESIDDDVAGDPTGHFVVLHGYDPSARAVWVADPLYPNPMAPTNKYVASLARVAAAILLGIVTYDANLLTIYPRRNSV